MDPLYYFKLDTDTATVTRYMITEYEEISANSAFVTRKHIRHRFKGAIRYVYGYDIDRFKSNRVYSYNPDMNHAIKIIQQALKVKWNKAKEDSKVFYRLIHDIKGVEEQ